ncbi:MAG: peptidoglycan DD-metalloendopeptidase family protein [Clostridia bacterium]|nr:peptidoglycan DD-metalloendopeptidase family protein [Clostridia bacterium]
MEHVHTACKPRRQAKYKSDEEYKVLKLGLGRVFIFAKKMPFTVKLGAAASFIISLLFAMNIISIGYNVYVGKTPVGCVAARHDGDAALSAAEKKWGGELSLDLKYYPRLVFFGKYSNSLNVTESMLLASGKFARTSAITVGDRRIVFTSTEEMKKAEELYMKPYKTENTVSARLRGARISEGLFKKDGSVNAEKGAEMLSGVNVITTERVNETETIERETETIEDNTLHKGQVTVTQEGADGAREVSRLITKVNGEVTKEYVIDEKITKKPVKRIETVGTFIPAGEGSGDFAVPVSGTVTSPFGERWGRHHDGTDFGAAEGTPVYAADSGTVSFCGVSGGYGNLIIINHKNGYETYYGHLSRILVSSGQQVEKGAKIGEVGSTGNSTGPHLHFEIRKNSVPQNPLNYLP